MEYIKKNDVKGSERLCRLKIGLLWFTWDLSGHYEYVEVSLDTELLASKGYIFCFFGIKESPILFI